MVELDGVAAGLEQVAALALVNYGHFTSMRVDDQRVRGLSLHLERLRRDCHRVFDADLDPDRVRCLIRHALAGSPRSVVRVTVFDPHLPLGHPGADAELHVLITTRAAALTRRPPALRLQSVRYHREMPEVKHVGLFGSLRHRRSAQRNGFDDVLFTDADALISEAATSNIGVVDGDRIVWPQADCLLGVTMRLITRAWDGRVSTAPVSLGQLAKVDAVFATNAAVGIRPISAIDGTQCSTEHPVLDVLRKQYAVLPGEPL